MIIIDYNKGYHRQIIAASVAALKQGKVVAYPTDTSYGLAADATNLKAIRKIYRIKERQSTKPIHVIVPSLKYAKTITKWSSKADKLARKFWPGPLTLVLGLKADSPGLSLLSAKTGFMGVRYPKNRIAMDLVKLLNRPITTPSANPPSGLGGDDSYSADDIIRQFKNKKFKPDIIINAGKLPKRKPSTILKITAGEINLLRLGPVSKKQINRVLGASV